MASPSTVLTLGYGSFGSVNLLPTLGFGIATPTTPGALPSRVLSQPRYLATVKAEPRFLATAEVQP